MTTRYDASTIQVLQGLEGVRTRPSMYIGSTGPQGAFHCVEEVLDNAVDEFASGFCSCIEVTVCADGQTICVKDNGRGIPIDVHPEVGRPALEVVLTTLHAGGKFSEKAYAVSAGLHGVGVSVVTALSEYLKAEVWRDGKYAVQEFGRGAKLSEMVVVDDPGQVQTGTAITFRLDPQIFGSHTAVDVAKLGTRLQELACLNPGLELTLVVCSEDGSRSATTFKSERGLVDLLELALRGKRRTPLHSPIALSRTGVNFRLQAALVWTNADNEFVQSYVNSVHTSEGGTHETGLRMALTRVVGSNAEVLLPVLGTRRKRSTEQIEIDGESVREGLVAFLHLQLTGSKLEFMGQTKTKLGSTEARSIVYDAVSDGLKTIFETQPEIARAVAERVLTAARAKAAAKAARERERARAHLGSTSAGLGVLPGKLADCTEHGPESELFLMEGDSAGGSGKSARDRRFQAVLPLRGKSLNVERATPNALAKNEELRAIAVALGLQLGKPVELDQLRYGKVVICTDADADGSHIRTLLLTFFYRCFPKLVQCGLVWVAKPPLYVIRVGAEQIYYAQSDAEKDKIIQGLGRRRYTITYLKGLGEMCPDQLATTAFSPETRTLYQITVEDAIRADALIGLLMGRDPNARRWFIEQYARLAKPDI